MSIKIHLDMSMRQHLDIDRSNKAYLARRTVSEVSCDNFMMQNLGNNGLILQMKLSFILYLDKAKR